MYRLNFTYTCVHTHYILDFFNLSIFYCATPTREGTFGFCEGPRFIFDKSWTATNLKESYLNYLVTTGQGVERSDKERTEGELAITICKSLNTVFDTRGRNYTIERWTKRKKIDNTLRPNGIWGLKITNGKESVLRDDDEIKPYCFEVKESNADPSPSRAMPVRALLEISDPFATDNVIPWNSSSNTVSHIALVQEQILSERRQNSNKTLSAPAGPSVPETDTKKNISGIVDPSVPNPSSKAGALTGNSGQNSPDDFDIVRSINLKEPPSRVDFFTIIHTSQ